MELIGGDARSRGCTWELACGYFFNKENAVWTLEDFIQESNKIEGILREPTQEEVSAYEEFLSLERIQVEHLEAFVSAIQPGAILRKQQGQNVRVGNHFPPAGGPIIEENLIQLLNIITFQTPYTKHKAYEDLHPFTDGNGRSGRVLWLWQMGGISKTPLGFLHHFYYQALSARIRN